MSTIGDRGVIDVTIIKKSNLYSTIAYYRVLTIACPKTLKVEIPQVQSGLSIYVLTTSYGGISTLSNIDDSNILAYAMRPYEKSKDVEKRGTEAAFWSGKPGFMS